MVIVHTTNGKHKLTIDASGDYRSLHSMGKHLMSSVYQTLHNELERHCMRHTVENILLIETMSMETSESIHIAYNMGFNIPITLAADVQALEFAQEDIVEVTGRLERVDTDLVRYRRSILITPTQINAMCINGEEFDEVLANNLQTKLNEHLITYPHKVPAVKAP